MRKIIVAILLLATLLLSLGGCAASREGRAYGVEAYRTTMQYYDDFKVLQLTCTLVSKPTWRGSYRS